MGVNIGALCVTVGTHRRIYFRDLQEYKDNIQEKRAGALDELVGRAQDLDMGY